MHTTADSEPYEGRNHAVLTLQRVLSFCHVWIVQRLLLQRPVEPSQSGRRIPVSVNNELLVDERRGHAYIPNTVHSSRYSLLDFLPRQIWFQSTRLHNIFFICIGVPQCISGLSTTGNFTTILPLLVFMCLTILKEGYDDYRRHRLDQVENKSLTTVLRRGQASKSAWTRPIRNCFRSFPGLGWTRSATSGSLHDGGNPDWYHQQWRNVVVGDILRIERNEPMPADVVLLFADGEDGLCYIETMSLDGETNLKSRRSPLCLQQCHDIDGILRCNAVVNAQDPSPDLHSFNGNVTVDDKSHPLTLNNVILRGCILRNTPRVLALVIRTGEECSIRMNANHHLAAKKPRLEKFANQLLLTLIVYIILITAGLSIGYMLWQHREEQNSFYIENAPVGYQQVIIGYGIMFNNVIPLALFVSLEIVRIGQMLLMNSDNELYDEASDTPMRCNTNTILENLGQVTHILSDKTGTLTQNVMQFRKMSFAGTKWTHPSSRDIQDAGDSEDVKRDKCAGPQIVVTESIEGDKVKTENARRSLSTHNPSFGGVRNTDGSTDELLNIVSARPTSPLAREARLMILGLAICHTGLPEARNDTIDFQAASPDEVALLRAAQELGIVMTARSSKTITLLFKDPKEPERREIYEILDVIEFSSSRKRMSVIVRCPDNRIWLICKGADSALLPRLRLATVAAEQAQLVRKSIDVDRRRYRKSMQGQTRSSIGDRLSAEGLQKHSLDAKAIPHASRPIAARAQSYELRGHGPQLRASLEIRPASLDIRRIARPSGSLRIPSAHPDLPKLSITAQDSDPATAFKRCFEDIDQYANEGLRTLLFTHRFIPEDEYMSWKKLYEDACTSLVDRESRVEETGEIIERSLDLLGVTAIEDKLQDGVPETIEKLRRVAKIFCLTGDKRETAISIAHSAGICRPESDIFVLDIVKGDLMEQMRAFALELESGATHSVLVVDGQTLTALEDTLALRDRFYDLVTFIDSVICCRASPAQKAKMVSGLRSSVPDALTLAIGDGSNDIAMIQAAVSGETHVFRAPINAVNSMWVSVSVARRACRPTERQITALRNLDSCSDFYSYTADGITFARRALFYSPSGRRWSFICRRRCTSGTRATLERHSTKAGRLPSSTHSSPVCVLSSPAYSSKT